MSIIGIFGGLVFGAIGFVIVYFLKDLSLGFRIIGGFFSGLGAMLVAINILNFFIYLVYRKNLKFRRFQDIASKDERNIMISDKAYAKAGNIMIWFTLVLSTIFTTLGEPLWVGMTVVVGLMLPYNILATIFAFYYDKRL